MNESFQLGKAESFSLHRTVQMDCLSYMRLDWMKLSSHLLCVCSVSPDSLPALLGVTIWRIYLWLHIKMSKKLKTLLYSQANARSN